MNIKGHVLMQVSLNRLTSKIKQNAELQSTLNISE